MTVSINDHQTLDAASMRVTKDGYLVAQPRVARIGIQTYTGDELGRPDLKVVNVFRPEAEVFSVDTLRSFASRPVTLDHPAHPVDSTNWRDLAIGHTGEEVLRDGDYIRIPLIVMDQAAIDKVKSGKAELSWGYTADIDWQAGENEFGSFDAVHTNIRGNHLAIVDRARGGPQLKIGDRSMKTIIVDGVSCQVEDTAAGVIEKTFATLTRDNERLSKQFAELTETHDAFKAEAATKLAEVTGERDTARAELKDATDTAKLDARVTARAGIIEKAKSILGDKLAVDGKSNEAIQRQVVDSVVGEDAKDWTDAQVRAGFLAIRGDKGTASAPRTLIRAKDDASEGYNGYTNRLRDAWRAPTAKEA